MTTQNSITLQPKDKCFLCLLCSNTIRQECEAEAKKYREDLRSQLDRYYYYQDHPEELAAYYAQIENAQPTISSKDFLRNNRDQREFVRLMKINSVMEKLSNFFKRRLV